MTLTPEAPPLRHGATVTAGTKPGHIRRACPCGWSTADFPDGRGIRKDPTPCPLDRTVVALCTVQFAAGGLLDARPVDGHTHLVRTVAAGGTPGATLCGIDRFAKGGAGWSRGGGVSGPGTPCPGCVQVARVEYPGLPVAGSVGGREMAAELGVERAYR